MRQTRLLSVLILAGALAACGSSSSPATPATPTPLPAPPPTLAKAVPDSPADGEQLDNVRPTLTVVNGTSNQSAAKSYEFQISDNSTFSASAAASVFFPSTVLSGQVPEDASGKTKYEVDAGPAADDEVLLAGTPRPERHQLRLVRCPDAQDEAGWL